MPTATVSNLEATICLGPYPLFAETQIPVVFECCCPKSAPGPVQIVNVDCRDSSLSIDSDLFQRDVWLKPGESLRTTLLLLAREPKIVRIEDFFIEFVLPGERSELLFLKPGQLEFLPSPIKEVKVKIEPLCTYEEGTKVLLSLEHQGATLFKEFRLHLEPEDAVLGAKTMYRSALKPGEKEQFECVLRPGPVELVFRFAAFGRKAEARKRHEIPVLAPRSETPPFRFLEPRRLSNDRILIREKESPHKTIEPARAVYPLISGEKYLIVIQPPKEVGVTEIQLQDIPGKIYVRPCGYDAAEDGWKFEIEVTYNELFREGDRLHYNVKSAGGLLTGEIYVSLIPLAIKHWIFATTLGVTVTAQGIGAVVRRILRPDISVTELFNDFKIGEDYSLLFLFAIPLLWLGIRAFDVIYYRLRT